MAGLDHIVLFVGKKTVLRRIQCCQLPRKPPVNQIAGMAKFPVHRCRVTEQAQPLSGKKRRGGFNKPVEAGLDNVHGVLSSG